MSFDFELILFYATLITGVVGLIDILFFARARKQSGRSMPIISEYARSFFPVLLIVFVLRSFFFEPFRIPTGSLEPTLLMGDFILVNKYDYGIRLPIIRKKIMGEGAPQRGDIMVFRWPANPKIYFIKRVIGLPGDKISYINKELYINGKMVPQSYLQVSNAVDESGAEWQAVERSEDLLGVKHSIFVDPQRSSNDYQDIVVPAGNYFVMGDNRDASADSRYWGFVPDRNIVGKAKFIWMSWDSFKTPLTWKLWDYKDSVRWHRIGTGVH